MLDSRKAAILRTAARKALECIEAHPEFAATEEGKEATLRLSGAILLTSVPGDEDYDAILRPTSDDFIKPEEPAKDAEPAKPA